jgi:hypothetical protein
MTARIREGVSAAEQMREHLARFRREGRPFPEAWACAFALIRFDGARDRKEWEWAWADIHVQSAWMAAYERRFHFGSTAVAQLTEMWEAVAYDETFLPTRPITPNTARPAA